MMDDDYRLLHFMVSNKLNIEEKSSIAQKFYEDTETHLKSIFIWSQLSQAELEASIDGIEHYIFSKINDV